MSLNTVWKSRRRHAPNFLRAAGKDFSAVVALIMIVQSPKTTGRAENGNKLRMGSEINCKDAANSVNEMEWNALDVMKTIQRFYEWKKLGFLSYKGG